MSQSLPPEQLELIADLLCELAALGKNIAVRGREHEATDEIFARYKELCDKVRQITAFANAELTVACRGERLYLEHIPLPESCQQLNLITPRKTA